MPNVIFVVILHYYYSFAIGAGSFFDVHIKEQWKPSINMKKDKRELNAVDNQYHLYYIKHVSSMVCNMCELALKLIRFS